MVKMNYHGSGRKVKMNQKQRGKNVFLSFSYQKKVSQQALYMWSLHKMVNTSSQPSRLHRMFPCGVKV